MTYSFKDKKEQIEITIELDDETLEKVKVNQIPLAKLRYIDGEAIEDYYTRTLKNIFRKNENCDEIVEKIVNELSMRDVIKLINNVIEEVKGKYLD